jgi:cholesterol transport system auxiliary component
MRGHAPAWLALVVAGCALVSRSPPLELRYFSPEAAVPAAPAAPAGAARPRLRLGRVEPDANLRYAIVHRDSPVELSPYETLRWTDTPDVYVRRALSRALFEARPLEQAVGGEAPTLEVDVVAFEEVRRGASSAGRVELRYELRDARRVVARGTVAAELPAPDGAIEHVVPAIGAAMDRATDELATRIAACLLAAAPPS